MGKLAPVSVKTLAVPAQPSLMKQEPSTQRVRREPSTQRLRSTGTWREGCAEVRRLACLAVRVAEPVHVHRQDAARAQDLQDACQGCFRLIGKISVSHLANYVDVTMSTVPEVCMPCHMHA